MPETKDKPETPSVPRSERDTRYRDKDRPRSNPKSEPPFIFTDWASI